jgi:hypothetical protein
VVEGGERELIPYPDVLSFSHRLCSAVFRVEIGSRNRDKILYMLGRSFQGPVVVIIKCVTPNTKTNTHKHTFENDSFELDLLIYEGSNPRG